MGGMVGGFPEIQTGMASKGDVRDGDGLTCELCGLARGRDSDGWRDG